MSDTTLEPTIPIPEPPGEISIEGPGSEPATDLAAVGGLFSADRRALSSGLVMTVTLIAFEALAISTVMPLVARDLGGLDLYGWVFSAFFLGNLVGIVVVGGLIDRGGLIRPLAVGLGLFAVGLVIGGLAPSMPVLVEARFLQGLGAGAIPPIAYVCIGRALPDDLRPQMFAVLSTAWIVPGVIGPALAGAVAERTTWRIVFLGLLPLIAVAGAITLPAIRAAVPTAPDPADATDPADPNGPADLTHPADVPDRADPSTMDTGRRLPLAIVVALGAALLVGGLTSGTILPGGALVVVGLVLVGWAFRRLTPPGTIRVARGLPAAILLRGVLTFAFFCADAYVPLALQEWRGLSATVAGIALTGATVAWTAGAWVQARRIGRWGAPRLVRSGFGVVAAGVAAFALVLAPSVPVVVGLLAWTLAGFGMGLAYSPLSLTVLREAPAGSEGSATSGLQLSDVLGTALGTGVGGALIAIGAQAGLETWVGLLGAFAVGTGAGLGGFALAGRIHVVRDGLRIPERT